jgi:hypothetical protein
VAGPLRDQQAAPPHQPPDALGAADGPAAERHYVVIYSAQEPGNHPRTSHCFATFARLAPARASSGGLRVELHHINWFIARGHRTGSTDLVEAGGRPTRPEPGENQPDRGAIRRSLAGLPLRRDEIEAIVAEVYPAAEVAAGARDAAAVTVHLFEHHGVLDDPRLADAFRAWGLYD